MKTNRQDPIVLSFTQPDISISENKTVNTEQNRLKLNFVEMISVEKNKHMPVNTKW